MDEWACCTGMLSCNEKPAICFHRYTFCLMLQCDRSLITEGMDESEKNVRTRVMMPSMQRTKRCAALVESSSRGRNALVLLTATLCLSKNPQGCNPLTYSIGPDRAWCLQRRRKSGSYLRSESAVFDFVRHSGLRSPQSQRRIHLNLLQWYFQILEGYRHDPGCSEMVITMGRQPSPCSLIPEISAEQKIKWRTHRW